MSTLIIYASKHGTTEKCAKNLSEKLTEKADLISLKQNTELDISTFETIIIGGSIYAGKIQKEISNFCSQNLELLKNKKLGLFICCMNSKEAEKQIENSYPKELLDIAHAKENFGGEFLYKDMNFMEKAIVKMVSKSLPKTDSKASTIFEENINKFAELINKA